MHPKACSSEAELEDLGMMMMMMMFITELPYTNYSKGNELHKVLIKKPK